MPKDDITVLEEGMEGMEGKKLQTDGVRIEFTALIDVVFLLLIFFMLIPIKEMEAKLETKVSGEKVDLEIKDPLDPKVSFNIHLQSQIEKQGLITRVFFNGVELAQMLSPTQIEMDHLEEQGGVDWVAFKKQQYKSDKVQTDPDLSPGLRALAVAIGNAIEGSPEGRHTSVVIRTEPQVPFKWVMAVFNVGVGMELTQLSFEAPGDDIWGNEAL